MAIIRRQNSKHEVRYQVKVRDGLGQWFRSVTFETKAAAEAYERQLFMQRDQGASALPESQRNMTIAEYWQVWTAECRSQMSRGWIISQDQMARDYVLPVLGARKLIEVRPQEIGIVLDRARQKGLAPQTVKHIYAVLHKMFEDAVEHYGWLGRNPVLGRYRPKIPIREREFLSPQEAMKLLELTKSHYLGPAIHLQILSGLRPSEVQALRWQAVDFERGQILIRAAFNNKEKCFQEHPKQDDWGMAPMPPKLKTYLAAVKASRNALEGDLVALSHKGKFLPYGTYLRALRPLCEKAGLKKVTPHELRHSCTELYVQAGRRPRTFGACSTNRV
ncbi:MAG: hypothetical protein A2428_00330 [Bdellovibrionales bacterium RIFOXYC1_FULL_54_43]|nr:MAG: hypothetical protein A2428_00330 [Bdellovibrionales bacterium RIFOXYC1_FULL_54_43]OFZ81902.1 MAG: hypothetical protein A2603_03020 [Bdellovibrionales bacterium RIFOXYD1_FULL_55_31]